MEHLALRARPFTLPRQPPVIHRILHAIRRRLRHLAAESANRRLTSVFRRAGGFVESNCLSLGRVLPLVGNAGSLRLGRRTVWQGATLRTEIHVAAGGSLEIGAGSFINQGVTIAAHGSIVIGPDCLIGEQVAIHDTTFHPISPQRPVNTTAVRLGRNVWLGHRAIVLPGVEIGDHTVVGAGAVVTKSLPARCIAVGMPARVVGTFECPDNWKRV